MANTLGSSEILVGTIVSSGIMACDLLLIRKLFFNMGVRLERISNQEKYAFYFQNKDLLDLVGINDLDSYSMDQLKEMVSYKRRKGLTRKRK